MVYDPLLWSRDLEDHLLGDYSSAEVLVRPCSYSTKRYVQVETLGKATFVGVYDRLRTPQSSSGIFYDLWDQVGDLSEDVIQRAIAPDGSYCLVGFIWGRELYVANLGDSRVVLGYTTIGSNNITAAQLTRDGKFEATDIVEIQAIEDAFSKSPDSKIDGQPYVQFSEPIKSLVHTAKPSIYKRVLQSTDDFLIFASHGLWEFLTNQDVVDIVHNNPRMGIAKRLVETALQKAARKKGMTYRDLKKVENGKRRKYHQDISVVVLFIEIPALPVSVSTLISEWHPNWRFY